MTSAAPARPGAAAAPARAGRRELIALAGLLAVAALARFAGIGAQSLWFDEVATAELTGLPFGELLSTVPRGESTPHLYYVLLWLWAQVAGDGEAGLRSLSAVLGVATVAATWAAARTLVSPRAGVAAAALAAVNPLLVWYSQEARAYALLALLCTVSLWCFARALARPASPGPLAAWAVASALALATHYFAAFTIVPEAVALALLAGRSRALAAACAAVAAAGLALVPLALEQRSGGGADWIGNTSLAHRIVEIPRRFAAGEFGYELPGVYLPVVACCVAAAVLLVRRSPPGARRGGLIALAIGGAGLLGPVALALAGVDYVFPRNLIGSLPALLVALAAGATAPGARRAGPALLVAVCALSAIALVRTATDDALQRDDWRAVSAELDRREAHVVVVSAAQQARSLRWYRPNMPALVDPGLATREVAAVVLTREPAAGRPRPRPLRGFEVAATIDRASFRLVILRAPAPVVVTPGPAHSVALDPSDALALGDLGR